jgi:pimeloyl-ACP methyl ester carboxylesterase
MTGIGERAHLTSPQVDLTTHVMDVVNTVLYEDLRDIVLLGYSYGGMVVTGALEYIGDRVSHLVYLDAFKPDNGQALVDLSGAPWGAPAVGPGGSWLIEPIHRFDYLDDRAEQAWFDARRTAHPAGCFTEAVRLRQPLEDYPFSRTYVKALRDPQAGAEGRRDSAFWRAAGHAQGSPAWRYREIDTDHMIPLNRPAELVELLLELV